MTLDEDSEDSDCSEECDSESDSETVSMNEEGDRTILEEAEDEFCGLAISDLMDEMDEMMRDKGMQDIGLKLE